MTLSLRHVSRLIGIARTLSRHDAWFVLEHLPRPPFALSALIAVGRRLPGWRPRASVRSSRPGRRLSAALSELGPSFVKLGQFLATRPDLVGRELALDLEELQDSLPPFPGKQAIAIMEAEFGKPLDALFERFEETPVAAASIAQVHFAETEDGRPVAVKVLRPGIEEAFRRDLELFRGLAGMLERRREIRRLRPLEVVATLSDWVALEMDLRLEAAAAGELGENTKNDGGFRTPAVDWTRTGRRAFVMERIDGVQITDRQALIDAGHDTRALAARVIQCFLLQALRDGFFHADMHQGNLFVDADGHIVAVDFGIMGRLDRDTRRFLAEILYGFIMRDYARVAAVHFEAGYVPANKSVETFAQACRSIGEPIHGQPLSSLSIGRLLAQLFEVTESFDMQTQPKLLLLQKTMVAVEGIAKQLDEDANMWDIAKPVLETWLADNLGPDARLREAADGMAALARRLPQLVEKAGRAADIVADGAVRLHPENAESLAREIARRNGERRFPAAALWVSAALLALAVVLWAA